MRPGIFDFRRDRDYYHSLLHIALPIALQGLISAGLNLVDNVMVSGLGATALAAVGLANQIYFILAIMLFGVSSGLTVFVAQYWGKKDIEGVRTATGLGVLVSIVLSLAFALLTAGIPDQLMGIFTSDPEVIALGAAFLRRSAASYPLMAVSFLYYGSMRNTGHAKPPIVSSTLALIVNTVLNYVLIYGKLGAPAMGVVGSATATLISRVLELAIILWIVYSRDLPSACRIRHIVRVEPVFFRHAMRISLPVMLNEGLWVIGASVYPAVYGHMGTDVIAAMNITSTIERIAFIFALGMGNAAAAIVGKEVGAGRRDLAYRYGGLTLILVPLTSLVIGTIVFVLRAPILSLFDLEPAVYANGILLLGLMSIFLTFKSYNMCCVVGVLRGGGDTVFSMLLDLLPLWLLAVPLASLGGLVLGWSLTAVYLMSVVDEVLKTFIGTGRFFSRRWIHDLVNMPSSPG